MFIYFYSFGNGADETQGLADARRTVLMSYTHSLIFDIYGDVLP